jgi:hypothetical protein
MTPLRPTKAPNLPIAPAEYDSRQQSLFSNALRLYLNQVDNFTQEIGNANNINYNEGSTGAVDRTVQNKLQESVSVKDFGAVGDGVTDDTAAIQAAVDYISTNGGRLYFPSGKFLISTTITIEKSGVWLEGSGSADGGTWIVNGTANLPAIKFGDGVNLFYSNGISQMLFGQKSGVVATAGNCGVMFNKCGTCLISDVYVSSFPAALYDGFVFENISQTQILTIRAQNCLNNGVVIKGDSLDLYVTNSRADSNGNNGWDIKFSNGLYFVNCTAYGNELRAWDIQTGSGSTYSTNNLFFVNCVGDTSGADNWYFDNVNSFYLSNCWGATQKNPAVNTGSSGFVLFGNLVTNGNFSNCAALYNNGDGLKIFGAKNINIVGGQFGTLVNGNGRAGSGSGISVLNNSENITISSIQSTGNANHGINIDIGTVRCNILGGTVLGNIGAAIFGFANATSIRSVSGFNPCIVPAQSVPVSGVAYVNNTGVDCNIYLVSGTVSQIRINGSYVLNSPPATIFLPAGSSITLIYTVAPTWTWVGN